MRRSNWTPSNVPGARRQLQQTCNPGLCVGGGVQRRSLPCRIFLRWEKSSNQGEMKMTSGERYSMLVVVAGLLAVWGGSAWLVFILWRG